MEEYIDRYACKSIKRETIFKRKKFHIKKGNVIILEYFKSLQSYQPSFLDDLKILNVNKSKF